MLIRQLFDPSSSTYTYLLADRPGGAAALIDPVLEQVDRDLALVEEKRWNQRLAGKSREDFIGIMAGLGLPPPRRLAESVPANRACGAAAPAERAIP